MSEKKRIQLTLSKENYDKVEEVADRYGITPNSYIAFIVGQWVDSNYNVEKAMADSVDDLFSSPEDLLSHPQLLEMIKEILKDDEDFKTAAAEKLNGE